MREHVLVTGGAGYIGSHAAKAVAATGRVPVVVDDLSSGRRDAVRWGPLVVGDVADRATLERTFERYRPSAVMHFAAFAYVGESVARPAAYYRNNVAATLVLLDAMQEHGVRHLVFSSSCASYGVPVRLPVDEAQPQRPINPYGRSKLIVEQVLGDYEAAYGLRSVALRYFNAAGADPDGELGENHDPETHLVPRTIRAALGIDPVLEVYGGDYPTDDGTAVRDFVHVADIAQAHVLALEHLIDEGPSSALNLGVGRGYSVREVVATVERVTGRRVPTRHRPRRPGDPPTLVADADRVRRVLGWRPRWPELEDMVEGAWRWLERRPERRHDGRLDRGAAAGAPGGDRSSDANPPPPATG